MMNPRARDLWRQYQAEEDPVSAEMIYLQYLQSLSKPEEAEPRKEDAADPKAAA